MTVAVMWFSQWFRSPRYVLVLVSCVTAVLTVAVAVLGWHLFHQEKKLGFQRLRERSEQAIDRAESGVLSNLATEGELLGRVLQTPPHEIADALSRQSSRDALALVLTAQKVATYPAQRLLYTPVPSQAPEPPGNVFEEADYAEFREVNYAKAIASLSRHSRSREPFVRAAALLRIGRNQRKAGDLDAALSAYNELEQLGATSVNGLPAELIARHAKCELTGLKRQPLAQQREAQSLGADLQSSRWLLSRGAYQFYLAEARRFGATALIDDPYSVTLAEGASGLWKEFERIRAGEAPQAGERSIWVENQPVVLIWRSNSERLVARVISAGYIERHWIGNADSPGQVFRIGINDSEGRALVSAGADSGQLHARRTLAGSPLQWTLHAALVNSDAEFAHLTMRTNLLLAGLGVIVLIALAGTYAITRAVNRELEIVRLQSDFVAAVSHEFRSPLTTMQQVSELLAAGRVPTEERRARYYEIIARETSRLRRLVEDLLDFGRMEAGAQVYRLQPLHIRELVTELVSDFQTQIESHGYQVVFDPGQVDAIVEADQEALRRVCWNLLDNAVKYSPECKTVWMDLLCDLKYVLIRVRDQGMGIAPADQRLIFQKFGRGSAATAASIRGTGLGLAMVHHIVNAHHGEIRIESKPGQGSTFTVLLRSSIVTGTASEAGPAVTEKV